MVVFFFRLLLVLSILLPILHSFLLPSALEPTAHSHNSDLFLLLSESHQRKVTSRLHASSSDEYYQKAKQLRQEAEALEKEIKDLQSKGAQPNKTNRLESSRPMRLPGSSWRVNMRIEGFKKDKGEHFPVEMSEIIKLQTDGVVGLGGDRKNKDQRYLSRGYVWEVERDMEQGVVWGQGGGEHTDRGTIEGGLGGGETEPTAFLLFGLEGRGLPPVPDGKLYFNACLSRAPEDGGIQITDGVITMKVVQEKAQWGFFNAGGILAEFKIVGSFTAEPVEC